MKGWRIPSYLATTLVGFAIAVAPSQELPQTPNPKPGQTASGQPKKQQPRRVVTDLSGFDLLAPSKVEKQTTVVGATRGLPQPVALAPRLGRLYGANPVFTWSYGGKAQNFVFTLRNDTQEEVFRSAATGPSFRYPAEAPKLEPEKTYFWTVEVSSPNLGSSQSTLVGFIVISPSQRAEVEKKLAQIANSNSYDASLARAHIFTDQRLWYDALDAYSDLIARYPDRAELYEQRGTIYAQLGATQRLAEQDFARADGLPHEK